jgi:hypothetical protein
MIFNGGNMKKPFRKAEPGVGIDPDKLMTSQEQDSIRNLKLQIILNYLRGEFDNLSDLIQNNPGNEKFKKKCEDIINMSKNHLKDFKDKFPPARQHKDPKAESDAWKNFIEEVTKLQKELFPKEP